MECYQFWLLLYPISANDFTSLKRHTYQVMVNRRKVWAIGSQVHDSIRMNMSWQFFVTLCYPEHVTNDDWLVGSTI